MSIRIKTEDAIDRLTGALVAAEAAVKAAEEGVVTATRAYDKFRKELVGHVKRSITHEMLEPGYWTHSGTKITVQVPTPDGLEWPERPWAAEQRVAAAQREVEEIKELIKLLSISATTTVSVTSGVFKSLAKHL